MAGPLLNWIDSLFFGIRLLLTSGDAEMPERPALKVVGGTLADDPSNNRTVLTIYAMTPDGAGGFLVGSNTAGWVTVRSDANGFRVFNDDASDFIFEVNNSTSRCSVRGELACSSIVEIGNVGAVSSPLSGARLGAVGGALRFAQHTPPSVTGSRGGNAALASLLATLASAGLIVDGSTA